MMVSHRSCRSRFTPSRQFAPQNVVVAPMARPGAPEETTFGRNFLILINRIYCAGHICFLCVMYLDYHSQYQYPL